MKQQQRSKIGTKLLTAASSAAAKAQTFINKTAEKEREEAMKVLDMSGRVLKQMDLERRHLEVDVEAIRKGMARSLEHLRTVTSKGMEGLAGILDRQEELRRQDDARVAEEEAETHHNTVHEDDHNALAESDKRVLGLKGEQDLLRAELVANLAQCRADEDAIAEFLARMLQKDARIAELTAHRARHEKLLGSLAAMEANNEAIETHLQELIDFLPGSCETEVTGVTDARAAGRGLNQALAQTLSATAHFDEDASFHTGDMLPFEKVLRKPAPVSKRLWPLKVHPPPPEPLYAGPGMRPVARRTTALDLRAALREELTPQMRAQMRAELALKEPPVEEEDSRALTARF